MLLHTAVDWIRHLDTHLNAFAGQHPVGVYGLLFAIVFCETGLVVTPFLPGDSLLFAVGALAAAAGSSLHLPLVVPMLCLAANLGDMLNYSIGHRLGPAVFRGEDSWLLSKKHLHEAQAFYDKHGRKTIILARFVPIIRTFAPFVAGIGRMPFSRFVGFSVVGGLLWVILLSLAGYEFGQFKLVREHFELVVVAIVVISVLPVVFHAIQSRGQSAETPPVDVPVR